MTGKVVSATGLDDHGRKSLGSLFSWSNHRSKLRHYCKVDPPSQPVQHNHAPQAARMTILARRLRASAPNFSSTLVSCGESNVAVRSSRRTIDLTPRGALSRIRSTGFLLKCSLSSPKQTVGGSTRHAIVSLAYRKNVSDRADREFSISPPLVFDHVWISRGHNISPRRSFGCALGVATVQHSCSMHG